MKKIVLPGDVVSQERKRLGEHVFLREGQIVSDVLGLSQGDNVVSFVVPLRGRYIPKPNDLVLGVVKQVVHGGYLVDLNSFYLSFVSQKELRDPLNVGSIVSAKIISVSETKDVEIGYVRAFFGGELLNVSPVKVPRMIGKNGSMLEVLKNGTGCSIMIGRNGRVWAKGTNTQLLARALEKIESEAHQENLTESVKSFLQKNAVSAK